jgi:hypothetical protein
MALVDRRLQPLFAVLIEAGYDWLVTETIEVIRQGRQRMADESELARVRAKIENKDESPESVQVELETLQPIEGDEQISFAVNLIKARFESIAKMIYLSQRNLDTIARHRADPRALPGLTFLVDDEKRSITPGDIEKMSGDIRELVTQLDDWAQSTRGQQ